MTSLCSTHKDPDLWYPEDQPQGRPTRAASHRMMERSLAAINVCNSCPVKQPCLELGMLEQNLEYGIWGGKLPGERIVMSGSRTNGTTRTDAISYAERFRQWASID